MSSRKSCRKARASPTPNVPASDGLDRLYTLAQAAEQLLGPPWTVSSLRTEIRKGRLVPMRIGGSLRSDQAGH